MMLHQQQPDEEIDGPGVAEDGGEYLTNSPEKIIIENPIAFTGRL